MGPLVLTQFPGLMVFTAISRLWELVYKQGNWAILPSGFSSGHVWM